jgi:hypothetical protein
MRKLSLLDIDLESRRRADLTSARADSVLVRDFECDIDSHSNGFEAQTGAGFGDAAENKLVESKAVQAVTKDYQDDGWTVRSVERDECGFDLVCSKEGLVENVEVKGVKGKAICFIITEGEVQQAQTNPKFFLVVVTSALSATPKLSKYSGAEFLQKFDRSPIAYRAVVKS